MVRQRRQNNGGGMRDFPTASPMSRVAHNTFTHPSFNTKLRRRPRSAITKLKHKHKHKPTKQRTVQLADWSSAVEVIHDEPHVWPHVSLQKRTSLFPADGDRQQRTKIHAVPFLSESRAPKTQYGTLKKKSWEINPPLTVIEQKTAAKKKRRKRLTKTRHALEREVLELVACDVVGLSSTSEHKEMLTTATQRVRVRYENPIDPYELPATLLHHKLEKKRIPGPDPHLLDVRTHDKIFRTFVPFEQQWLDLWGTQNAVKGNCNAHCVRSIYKWGELKAKGRKQRKEESRKRRHHHQMIQRRGGSPKKKVDADMQKIIQETNALLRKPL